MRTFDEINEHSSFIKGELIQIMKTKLRARTTNEKIEKKRLILSAAKRVFFERGYQGTTIQTITRTAGVSIGTFYIYYKNKIEVYKDLQNEGVDILIQMIDASVSGDLNPVERLVKIALTYHRYFKEYREYFDIIAILSATPSELKETDSLISKIVDSKTYTLLASIEQLLCEGVEQGFFMPMDTWAATSTLWALMDGMLLLEERNNITNVIQIDHEKLIKQGLDIFFRGLQKNQQR